MSFEQLRARHPRFTYEDYAVERGDDALTFTFSFTMDPHIAFAPTTTLRAPFAAQRPIVLSFRSRVCSKRSECISQNRPCAPAASAASAARCDAEWSTSRGKWR